MKQLLFLFIASLMTHYSSFAQTISPMVQDGKVWIYEGINIQDYVWDEIFSLEGDTMIGSRQCMKLYFTSESVYGNYDHVYKGAVFEKGNGNVYFIAPGATTPVLMYDFSSEPGTIIKVGPFDLKIKEKKLVKYRSEYLKIVYYLPLEDEVFDCQWIEGVGIIDGGNLTYLVDGYGTWYTGGGRYLKMCTINDKVVYDSHEFHTLSEIVTGISKSAVLHSNKRSTLCDLQGRQLLREPQHGIYIRDGKKIAVK